MTDADLFVLKDQRLAKAAKAAFGHLAVLARAQGNAEANLVELLQSITEVKRRIAVLERTNG